MARLLPISSLRFPGSELAQPYQFSLEAWPTVSHGHIHSVLNGKTTVVSKPGWQDEGPGGVVKGLVRHENGQYCSNRMDRWHV